MYQLIADSGSTKTDWALINNENKETIRIKTIGFNPYFQDSEYIHSILSEAFSSLTIDFKDVNKIYYYGAGCSTSENKEIVKIALAQLFSNSTIEIHHDLIAAARATLGKSDGIACILGTGSNSCVWKNEMEIANIESHGYILGDEGSGSHLGIKLIQLYLSGKLNEEIKNQFDKEFNISKKEILYKTYREKNPNVFLASFAKFYQQFINETQLRTIILNEFEEFFQKRIIPYKDYQKYEVGFIGSISFFYKEILLEIANKYSIKVSKITRCPIDELILYHSTN
ncbi:MAG: BadF/BadG/BcrA/BcrD ATPase family protein [Wenyingzhuangia sp.]|jgi:glucosamine kinase|uniref:BadF/BadG/BcrA/BcrD ATPase family protein n=1 Tax=Wenyingzhuangia sp. TaxID=1964193 RepID=UPI00321C3A03